MTLSQKCALAQEFWLGSPDYFSSWEGGVSGRDYNLLIICYLCCAYVINSKRMYQALFCTVMGKVVQGPRQTWSLKYVCNYSMYVQTLNKHEHNVFWRRSKIIWRSFSGFVSYLVVVMFKGRVCLTYTAACLGLFALMEIQLLHLHSNELLRASAVL